MDNTDGREIREMLRSSDPCTRRDACSVIAEKGISVLIPELVRALSDEDLGVKEAALNSLITLGGAAVAEAVEPLLRTEDASLRNIAIEVLANAGPETARVISKLLNDKDEDIIKFAVDIIAGLRDTRFKGDLEPLLKHANPNIRASTAVCLGRIKADGSLPLLLGALKDTEEWVKFSVIEGIGLLEDAGAMDPLFDIIENGDGLVKEAAFEAVSRLAGPEDAVLVLGKTEAILRKGHLLSYGAVLELLEKAMVPSVDFNPTKEFKEVFFWFFSKGLDDGSRATAFTALKGLSLLNMREGLPKVLRLLDSVNELGDEDEAAFVDAIVQMTGHGPLPQTLMDEVRKGSRHQTVLLKALGEIKSEEAVPLLESLIEEASKEECRELVTSLETIASSASLDALLRLLKNRDGHTRKTAARALSRLAGSEAAPPLFEALKAEVYRDVMEEMTDSLTAVPTDFVKRTFCALLSEPKDSVREMALRALGRLGDEESLPFIRKAISDASSSVRKAAYKTLAQIGIPDSVEDLTRGLADRDADVRLSVIKCLSGWSGGRIKAALMQALGDGNMWVRYHAVMLLGEMPDGDIEAAVLKILENDDPPVKVASIKALEKMGTPAAVKALERLRDHADPTVKGAAEKAIAQLSCSHSE